MDTPPASSWTAARRSVFRRWPVVLAVALMAVVAALVVLASRSSSYQSSAKLLIVPLSQDDQTYFGTGLLRDGGDPGLTAATAAQVLHSQNIGQATAAGLGHGTTADTVLAHVQLRPTPETNVLDVTASAASPAGAVRLSRSYIQAVMGTRWRLVSADIKGRLEILYGRPGTTPEQIAALQAALRGGTDPTVLLAQPAAPAKVAAHTSPLVVVLLALFGGLFVGVFVAFGIDRLTDRIRDADDARHQARLPVWAEVPSVPRRLRRGGAILPSRLPPAAAGSLRGLALHVAQRTSPDAGAVALVSVGPRDGRTTTALTLAIELGRAGLNTALVLLDTVLDDAALQALSEAGVWTIEAGPVPLASTLERIRGRPDLVVIDGPAVTQGIDLVAFLTSAQLLLVARANHTTRHGLAEARVALTEIGARPIGMVVLGVAQPRRRRHGNGASRDASEGPGIPIEGDQPSKPWDATVGS